MSNKGFLIAAPQSGSGKTIIALGIMAAMKKRGLKVAPFKCGPDFIDPGYHRLASGRTSINLDGWMCPLSFVAETFRLHSSGADIAIIEGVMGLFDGMGAAPMEGSSAQIAFATGAPVVLVVNARGMAASAAALVKGFAGFDPRVRLAGVIFNNVGSASHAELLRSVMAESLPEVAVLGCMPRDESLLIPSRHLGLVTAEDNPLPQEYLDHLIEVCEQCLDIEGLMGLETTLPSAPLREQNYQVSGDTERRVNRDTDRRMSGDTERRMSGDAECWVNGDTERWVSGVEPRIAVASDAAFCFVYEDNLRLLREAGLETVSFSPLKDTSLPADISGIYLPGGYPELYAGQLTDNRAMRQEIRAAVESGMPVYAECGGFIYLTEGMESGGSEQTSEFVGVFPVRARMLPKRKALGYRQVESVADCVIAAAGETARGHEFHYSEIAGMPERIGRCYMLTRREKQLGQEGYRYRNCLASYVHLHFGSNPAIASNLYNACREYRKQQLEI